MLGKGRGGLCKASTKEERRKRKAKRRERDQIKFSDLRFLLQVYLIVDLNYIITNIILFLVSCVGERP